MARRRIVQPSAPGSEEITHPAEVLNGGFDDLRIREAAFQDERARVAKEVVTSMSGELAGIIEKVNKEEQHTRARGRFDFEVAQAAKMSPLRPDVARVMETIFVSDVAKDYKPLEEELHLGDDHSDRGSLIRRLARAPVHYRKAHKLLITAKREREAWEKRNAVIFGAMWQAANKELQDEKDQKIRNKQITDADVSAKAAVIFGDEWTVQEIARYEAKLMIDSLENLVETWGIEARALEAMLSKSR